MWKKNNLILINDIMWSKLKFLFFYIDKRKKRNDIHRYSFHLKNNAKYFFKLLPKMNSNIFYHETNYFRKLKAIYSNSKFINLTLVI